ncbi:ApaG domain [Candidatus Palibaumannia cicadellinicola]|nr:ApaG domain [Candidatus Baumannia cicadellinicola]
MTNASRICIKVQRMKSQLEENRYVFTDTITLQIMGRYLLITNAYGQETEVQSKDVIGEQLLIIASGKFQYTSGGVLETPLGTMQRYYEMLDYEGQSFRVALLIFRLAIPTIIN